MRGMQWCGASSFILFVGYFWTITSQIMIMTLVAPHSWMHLVESSTTEVSGASEVPQLISLVKTRVDWNTIAILSTIFGCTSSVFDFLEKRKKAPDFFDEKSKTGLSFEIGQPQQNCQCRTTLQSLVNPAVVFVFT